MKNKLYIFFIIIVSVFTSQKVFSAVANVSSQAFTTCVAEGAMMTDDSDCKATPTQYSIKIYEMGLCESHPYGTSKTSATIDKSSCTVTYTDASPVAVDVAAAIGSTLPLTGTSTPPAEGTFKYPYMIMDKAFIVSGSFTNTVSGTSTTYYSAANNAVSTSEADFAATTENLTNFGDGSCGSGYIGANVTGGTLDGFITDTAYARSQSSEITGGECDKSGRLVGVMTLNNPVQVTSDTIAVIFRFILTDYGIQFTDGDDAGVVPDASDGFGSAPFSGYFTVLNAN